MYVAKQLTVSKAKKSGISSITAAHCREAPRMHMDSDEEQADHEHGQEKRCLLDETEAEISLYSP